MQLNMNNVPEMMVETNLGRLLNKQIAYLCRRHLEMSCIEIIEIAVRSENSRRGTRLLHDAV